MKNMVRIFQLIIAAIFIVCILVFLVMIRSFSYIGCLEKFEKQLYESDMPYDTQIIERQAVEGKLYGTNGEHYDFLASILIVSNKSLYELEQYFSNMAFKPASSKPKKYGELKVKVKVIKMTDSTLHFNLLEHETITFESLREIEEFTGYYAVVIYDEGYY